jgi:hypothetical protein
MTSSFAFLIKPIGLWDYISAHLSVIIALFYNNANKIVCYLYLKFGKWQFHGNLKLGKTQVYLFARRRVMQNV